MESWDPILPLENEANLQLLQKNKKARKTEQKAEVVYPTIKNNLFFFFK